MSYAGRGTGEGMNRGGINYGTRSGSYTTRGEAPSTTVPRLSAGEGWPVAAFTGVWARRAGGRNYAAVGRVGGGGFGAGACPALRVQRLRGVPSGMG